MRFEFTVLAFLFSVWSSLSFAQPSSDWHAQIINAPKAWAAGFTGKGVIVAVIDSGINLKDSQLESGIFSNAGEIGIDKNGNDKSSNGIDDDQNGFVDDVHGWNFASNSNDVQDDSGRGTGISSLIVSKGTIAGIAPDATVLPLKFFDPSGSGNISDAIKAMDYAAKAGAKVMLFSWGSTEESPAMKAKISELDKQGILMVAAAGNAGDDLTVSPEFPASYSFDSLLAVASTTPQDYVSYYSNYGATVELAAPGDNLLVQGLAGPHRLSGTSFSAAIVAGAAALALEKYPTLKGSDVKARLLKSAAKINASPLMGRLDIFAAL